MLGLRQILNIPPGVNKEDNSLTSLIYTDANNIRFYKGFPQQIGGWVQILYNNSQTLSGVPRTIFSYIDNNNVEHILIGTHTRLYSFEQGSLYNITPLITNTTAIANSLSTNYATLGTNPVSVTNSSSIITITYSPLTQVIFQVGDIINISGIISSIGGIASGTLNSSHSISTVTSTTLTFSVDSIATSTATGGTNCILASRTIIVSHIAHRFLDGDRIKILAATDFGGFIAADLNIENVIRYISVNSYAYYLNLTTNFATSSVSNGGGSATTVQGQIAAGSCTIGPGIGTGAGFGGGAYGVGKYGVGKAFTSPVTLPRIWSFDEYANTVILTAGNQTGIYQWLGNINTAPTLISNAPTAINYLLVAKAENQIISFGAGGTNLNRVYTSDSADITNWTPGAASLSFDRNIAGAGSLISSAYVKGQYLLFTTNAVYIMIFVDKPDIWVIKLLTAADGIIGPNAAIELPDAVVWRGQNDFYIYNGSVLREIPNNTLLNWVNDNINNQKSYFCFVRKVIEFNELWWFFPTGQNDEPDTYIIWNYEEGHWTNGTLTRTAAEKPINLTREQYLTNGICGVNPSSLYKHEVGFMDNGNNMGWSLNTNYSLIDEGDKIQQISAVIPSSYILPIGTPDLGNILYSLTINTKEYDGQSTPRVFGPYNILASTTKIDTRASGRQRQYIYNSSTQLTSNQTGVRIEKSFEMIRSFTVR